MGNKNYIPPKRNIKFKSKNKPPIPSSHTKLKRPNNKPGHERAVHPDEAQLEAATELNPTFVNPDGSINYWAGIVAPQESTTDSEDDPEDK